MYPLIDEFIKMLRSSPPAIQGLLFGFVASLSFVVPVIFMHDGFFVAMKFVLLFFLLSMIASFILYTTQKMVQDAHQMDDHQM